MDTVQARGLRKTYGDTRAVDGIDLSVPAGQVVAILGANGAGKTTLIEMLLGMRRPDAGEVALFGQRPGSRAVKARVGAMLQDSDIPQSLTVAEIVGLVATYYPRAVDVGEALRRADLTAKADTRANQLSGGQRQRLSFAMAIVGAPDLLFLDEPTAALDVEARRAFWEQVRGYAAEGVTVLFASHHMGEVEALADRVVVVHRGRVVADDTPAHVAGAVATRRISLTTDVPESRLRELVGTVAVHRSGTGGIAPDGLTDGLADGPADGLTRYDIDSTAPEQAVGALFRGGARVDRLVVGDADMETAFLHLIGYAA
jgi:ABC-2 type transport system ATP-binding protein